MGYLYSYYQLFKNHSNDIKTAYVCLRCIAYCYFIQEYLFSFTDLEGKSMEPTFNEFGDVSLLDKRVNLMKVFFPKKSLEMFTKNDIVSVINPFDKNTKLCKRILAVEGERVYLQDKDNYVDIPKNHVWIEGDNKDNSLDSRAFGPISKHLIVGKVVAKIYPFNERKIYH